MVLCLTEMEIYTKYLVFCKEKWSGNFKSLRNGNKWVVEHEKAEYGILPGGFHIQ